MDNKTLKKTISKIQEINNSKLNLSISKLTKISLYENNVDKVNVRVSDDKLIFDNEFIILPIDKTDVVFLDNSIQLKCEYETTVITIRFEDKERI